MKKNLLTVCLAVVLIVNAKAQVKTDTVIIPLANTSKVVFTIQDRKDIEILRHYNFQQLFEDIIEKLDTARSENPVATIKEEDWSDDNNSDDNGNDDDGWSNTESRRSRVGRTWQSTNIDIGTNNYLADQKFPDGSTLYDVRPWGSWYVGITSVQRTRVAKNLFLEWGFGVSWYNFKFEDNDIFVTKTDDATMFSHDIRDMEYIKSKLTASYVNASFVPVIDVGDHSRKPRVWDGYGSEFRIGLGPYVGYRIGSKSKIVFEDEDGDREREKHRDSYHLNNLRYGARLQVGFRSTDFFVNYDFNELFVSGKGPQLNAISFGVIF